MLEILTSLLREVCNFEDKSPIVVGLSGGADSQCLFDLLHRIGLPLVVAHYNHNLRPDSSSDADAVKKLAESYHTPFLIGSGDVKEYVRLSGMSVEEAARELRYEFLFSQARRVGAKAVAVGHHADDQVESILMHFIRGSGMAGLRGMQICQIPNMWSSEIALLRPLISFWRDEILDYCKEHGLVPLEDYSNRELIFWRNRIRLELIPYLETYNPQLKRVIWRMSRSLASDFEWIDDQVRAAWERCVVRSGTGYVVFNFVQLQAQPLVLRRRLIIRAVEAIRQNTRDIDFDLVERVNRALLDPPSTRQLDIGLGIRIFWEHDFLWFAAQEADLPFLDWPQILPSTEEPGVLQIPGILDLGNGWRITAQEVPVVEALQSLSENDNPYQAWVAVPETLKTLIVRRRKPGERFQPFGMDGHSQKLADFMINVKIPARCRDGWPLVCIKDKILWIPGYTIHHTCRVIESSAYSLWLQLTRE